MLTYLINVTNDILAVSLVIGVMLAFINFYCGNTGKTISRCALGVGFIAAAVRAYITNTTRLTGSWRIGTWGYVTALALFILMIIAFIALGVPFFRKKKLQKVSEIVISALSGLTVAGFLFSTVNTVYAYPFKFNDGGNGYLSTDFLFRLGGYLLGIVLCCVAAVAVNHVLTVAARKGHKKALSFSFFAAYIIFSVNVYAKLMSVLLPRPAKDLSAVPVFSFIVNTSVSVSGGNKTNLFSFISKLNNSDEWFAFAIFIIVLIITVFVWVWSCTAKEPYATKAEHRKQRALWRSGKRYGVTNLICFVIAILCATWFVTLNTVVINEAPVEEPIVVQNDAGEDYMLLVPIETVSDGHLHRYGYTVDKKVVRFIVMLKQENTSNYGVGLDACEICGEAGYYENNDGKVVCKKCGVIMNTSTIGMKGGCNPIIIDYDMDEDYIYVPVSEMVANASHFN